MNNTLHTPAPWQVSPLGNVMKNSLKIASIEQMPSNNESERIANARLIAATPDLLDALENLVKAVNLYAHNPDGWGELKQAQAAITKAKGEA